ncbi:uncharacterized protein M6B38_313875 [Iris pallida]|uniref:Uncharacterized protein n=1 Tax=Iris pallida TaxID=29817 RepID=A0AAX6HEN4_IRIPA|nr:uncharacterized protein M6B38_313875 [Iris pallida]
METTPVVLELPNPNSITSLNGLWTFLLLLLLAAIAAASFATTRTTTKKLSISRILFRGGKSVNTPFSSYCFSDYSSDDEEEEDEDDDDESYSSDEDDDDGSDEENHGEEGESKRGQYCKFHEPDFDWQNSVVKFWEGLDFGLGSADPTRLTAEADRGGNVAVRVWDPRASPPSESAAAVATWRTVRGREEEKVVYVGGGGGDQVRERLTVVDLRNVKTTLGELRRQCWSDGVTMASGEGSGLNMIDWLLRPQ